MAGVTRRSAPDSSGCGCGASGPGIRLIDVGGTQIGLSRLDEILAAVRRLGLGDESAIKSQLLRLAREANYVPREAESAYQEALWREYAKPR